MLLKRTAVSVIILALSFSIPLISSQLKNRVAVSEADRIKLYEFNSSSLEFDLVWESADIYINPQIGSPITDLHIVDIDDDGKCELIAVDQYGIFIWGENGKYPQYFQLQGPFVFKENYISVMDINGDSRMELITQQGNDDDTRRISVWKIGSGGLSSLGNIVLPGSTSWSLRHGDFDGDGKEEILTSSNLIHILGWKDDEGLVIKAEIPNLAQLVDVVRAADIDGDGIDEIIASGNSGVFSVYKHRKIHDKDFFPLYFQSMVELGKKPGFSQGLHFDDIDGDGIKEILVGLTAYKGDNIFVYKGFLQTAVPIGSTFQFEQVFSMPLEGSGIPGFVIGDLDNDGLNEVIYNNKFVLKFHKDIDGNMRSESLGEISQTRRAVAIGSFYPSGDDKPQGIRLNPSAITIDLAGSDFIESEKTYQIRVKLKSFWHDVSHIRVALESETDFVEIEPTSVSFDSINAGQEVENIKQPFILRTKSIEKPTRFELKLIIEAENGFRMEQKISSLQSDSNTPPFYFIQPKKQIKSSETIAISSGEGIYEKLGIKPDYFNDTFGTQWPTSDDLKSYKNLIMYDEQNYALVVHRGKLKSFLDNGGNCLLHGYFQSLRIEDPIPPNKKEFTNFINSYLQVRYLDKTDQVMDLKGQPGDIISDGLHFDLKIKQEGYSPGIWDPLDSATPILFYPDGQVAGVRIDGPYKMVILPFYLNDIESVEVRKLLLQRIMGWFNQE